MKINKSLFFIATILFLSILSGCNSSYSKALTYSGTVECTQYDIQSEVSGKVTEIFADEGESINKGQNLVQVDNQLLSLKLQESKTSLQKAKIQLEEAKKGTRKEQIQQAQGMLEEAKARLRELQAGNRPEQIRQGEIAVESAQNTLNQAQNTYDYQKDLVEDYKTLNSIGSISSEQLEQAQNLLDQYDHQVVGAKNQLAKSKSQLELLQKGATTSSIEAAQAAVKQAQAQYDMAVNGSTSYQIDLLASNVKQLENTVNQAEYALSKAFIPSPINGTLVSSWVKEGEVISPGSVIATVDDLKDMWVKIYVEEKNLHLVKLGQKVPLYFSSSDKKIEGKVTYISSEMEFTPKNTETKEARENTVFEVKIQIPPTTESIKPGMNMEVELWNMPSE